MIYDKTGKHKYVKELKSGVKILRMDINGEQQKQDEDNLFGEEGMERGD